MGLGVQIFLARLFRKDNPNIWCCSKSRLDLSLWVGEPALPAFDAWVGVSGVCPCTCCVEAWCGVFQTCFSSFSDLVRVDIRYFGPNCLLFL